MKALSGLLLLLSSFLVEAKLGESHVKKQVDADQRELMTKKIEWSTNFPLALCQGDCDSDFDCQGGLVCFKRNEKQAVPGCIGGEHDWSKTNYCVSQATQAMQPRNRADPPGVKLPVEYGTSYPLGRCQGDCNVDSDCQGNLKCFQRSGGGRSVPSCSGGSGAPAGADYCYDPNFKLAPASITTPQNNRADPPGVKLPVEWSSNFPLGRCQGDCDSDNDCRGNLKCYQRNGGKSVPSCLGGSGAPAGADYCYDPNFKLAAPTNFGNGRTAQHVGDENFSANPLGECQGDCDSDNDCLPGLFCWQRSGGESMPHCTGAVGAVDYCVPKSKFPGGKQTTPTPPPTNPPTPNIPPPSTGRTAQHVGDENFSANPLGVCQGDCDSDNDCSPGLFCWQRNAGASIPYCTGAVGAVDYCVPNSENPGNNKQTTTVNPPSTATKLRLYWDNYFWQETNEETFWCMECAKCDRPPFETADGNEGNCRRRDRCEEGDLIWIDRCRDVRHRFEIIKNNGSGDQIRAHGTNLCFQHRGDRGQFMELRPCDRNRGAQLWTPITNRGKFEIRPYYQRNRSSRNAKCVSQLHHPKAEEVLSLRQCWLNRKDQTNYWEVWN